MEKSQIANPKSQIEDCSNVSSFLSDLRSAIVYNNPAFLSRDKESLMLNRHFRIFHRRQEAGDWRLETEMGRWGDQSSEFSKAHVLTSDF